MRWLVRFLSPGSPEGTFLTSMKALATAVGVDARNPKWTSYGALELDVFCPTAADLEMFVAAADPIAKAEFVTDLNRAPEHLTEDEILSKAKRLFDTERYWECHEVLEGLWRQKEGDEKRLMQGLILLCAAYVHHQKGEDEVALGVLVRSERLLALTQHKFGPFDVPRIKNEVELMLAARKLVVFTI